MIGRQLISFFRSFPALGMSFRNEVLWEGGKHRFFRLYSKASFRVSPKSGHKSLMIEYGIPSGPGAESLHV